MIGDRFPVVFAITATKKLTACNWRKLHKFQQNTPPSFRDRPYESLTGAHQ